MKRDPKQTLDDIYQMLEMILEKQDKLLEEVKDIKQAQQKLHEEVQLNNFVLNNIAIRSEILN